MSKREDAAFQDWLSEMKSQFPDSAPQLDALAGTTVGREFYRGGLREDEFHRRMNDHNEKVKKDELAFQARQSEYDENVRKLQIWFADEKPKNEWLQEERQRLVGEINNMKVELTKAGVEVPAAVTAVEAAVPKGRNVDAEALADLREQFEALNKGLPHMFATTMDLTRRMVKEGYDNLNPADVIAYAAKRGVDPYAAFDEITKPEREARDAKRQAGEIEKAREEGRREALSKLQGPDRIRPAAPSVIDALRGTLKDNAPITDKNARVDAAISDYLTLQDGKA